MTVLHFKAIKRGKILEGCNAGRESRVTASRCYVHELSLVLGIEFLSIQLELEGAPPAQWMWVEASIGWVQIQRGVPQTQLGDCQFDQ